MRGAVGIENPAFVDFLDVDNDDATSLPDEITESETEKVEDTTTDINDNITEDETHFSDTVIENIAQYSPASDDFVKCRITRDRKGIEKFGYPTYNCYLDDGGVGTVQKLVLSARKRKKAKASSYLIATNQDNLNRDAFIAKLKSNLVGTRFTCYDNGRSYDDKETDDLPGPAITEKDLRREFTSIIFDQNVLGFKGPRKMTIVLPKMNHDDRTRIECRPTSEHMSLLGHFDEGNLDSITVHHNRQPMWNETTQSYVLNFNGRVTQASVKNFQITAANDPTETVMQFGRIKNDIFTMDYRYPMSAVQAFAIALSSFDPKIACE